MPILGSCTASFGEKYTFKNLEIYYTPPGVNERYVEGVANYFDEHDLILNKKHSIQLTSDEESFVMKMVLNNKYKALPSEQEVSLKALESDIKSTVFQGLNFRIEVCNANFVSIKSGANN